jgi:Domain of unknown function.
MLKQRNLRSNGYFREDNSFVSQVCDNSKFSDRLKDNLRGTFYFPLNLMAKFQLYFLPKPSYKKKFKIAICAIFKNEDAFLEEWIEYHLILGVEHFFLYNNNSEDCFLAKLKPYIDAGLVTLNDCPSIPGQLDAYKHWYENYRHETQWCTFLDIDEFICPKYKHTILDWLRDYEKYPVVLMYWLMFGTSGKISPDSSIPMIEQYTNCWSKKTTIGKVFYNTDFDIVELKRNMNHFLKIKWKWITMRPFNDSGNVVINEKCHKTNNKGDTVQINHYWSRSFEDYKNKVSRGRAAFKENWLQLSHLFIDERNNISSDHTIFRYLLELKLKLRK